MASNVTYPSISQKSWWELRARLGNVTPKNFLVSKDYVASVLGMTPKGAANLITSLRTIGLVDETGHLTDLAIKWRDDDQYAAACREMVELVYPEELRAVSPPDHFDGRAAMSWFTGSSPVSPQAGKPYAQILLKFYELLCSGDVSAKDAKPTQKAGSPRTTRTQAAGGKPKLRTTTRKVAETTPPTPAGDGLGPSALPPPKIEVAIQIYVNEKVTPEQIEKIFSSMARHLYGRG